jgi:hypothetical protein
VADTRDALVQALRAHVHTEGDGAYLTDWIVIAASAALDDPDATTYISECSDGPIHHRLGLIRYLSLHTDQQATGDHDDD